MTIDIEEARDIYDGLMEELEARRRNDQEGARGESAPPSTVYVLLEEWNSGRGILAVCDSEEAAGARARSIFSAFVPAQQMEIKQESEHHFLVIDRYAAEPRIRYRYCIEQHPVLGAEGGC